MSTMRACVLSVLLVPALAFVAADVVAAEKVAAEKVVAEKVTAEEKAAPVKAAPTKSNPPPVSVSGSYLIDKTIPAYGVLNQVPHYTDSRANALYLEIHQVLADVESQVMSGNIAVRARSKAPMADDKKNKIDAAPTPISDARIGELHARLVELDARIAYRTYLEQWHVDSSFSDLSRAAEMLALSGQIGVATAEKVQATKPKVQPEAAPAAVAPKVEVPAADPVKAPAAPVAPPEAPAAPAAPVEAPAAPAAPVEAPAAPAEAPAAPPVAEPPAAEPPAADPPAADPPADK